MAPLHLVELSDCEQIDSLYHLLRYQPGVVRTYLDEIVFPSTMAFAPSKLAASAQEVGGDLLFDLRYGVSGTPSDPACIRLPMHLPCISQVRLLGHAVRPAAARAGALCVGRGRRCEDALLAACT